MSPQISIVVPLYNESETFPLLVERLDALMQKLDLSIEVVLIDDGSKDDTAQQMYDKAMSDSRYQALFLSRNFGHQLALTAGLAHVRCTEAAMIVDGDLQDPPELLEEFYKHYQRGFDVVAGVRRKRKESGAKRLSYHLYYRLQKMMAHSESIEDSGDFSLISRRVVDVLNSMPEENRYLRGMRSWIGFKQTGVEYERDARAAGEPKYSWRMLLQLAYSGIFNFSNLPLKFITYTGVLAIFVSIGYLTHTLYKKYILQDTPEGFTGLLFTVILLGGVQLVSVGILGEYIARIFFQVKSRPLFLVRQHIADQQSEFPSVRQVVIDSRDES